MHPWLEKKRQQLHSFLHFHTLFHIFHVQYPSSHKDLKHAFLSASQSEHELRTTWTSEGTLERKSRSSLLSIMYGSRSFLVNLFTPAEERNQLRVYMQSCGTNWWNKTGTHPRPAQGIEEVWGREEPWPSTRQWSPASLEKALSN